MFEVTLEGAGALAAKLSRLPDALNAALAAKSQLLATAMLQVIQNGKLSGGVLNERTGLLKSSIDSAVEEGEGGPSASIFVTGDVPYAAIQEYGGTTKAHVIEATQGKALAFSWAGKQSFFTFVNHPGSVIPERSYLRSTLDDMQDDITDGFAETVGRAVSD